MRKPGNQERKSGSPDFLTNYLSFRFALSLRFALSQFLRPALAPNLRAREPGRRRNEDQAILTAIEKLIAGKAVLHASKPAGCVPFGHR
jgi:hypothetical protein